MPSTSQSNQKVITHIGVKEHFRETVSAALSNQKVHAQAETVYYLVNLLDHFALADRLFQPTPDGLQIEPLALLYAKAIQANRLETRQQVLRRLGDIALFVSGLFSGSLNRKLVDVDYYIGMGSSAYSHLSDISGNSIRSRTFNTIYSELSAKFQEFVDVLAEVGENSQLTPPEDTLRLYEIWARTGSPRAADKLRKRAIEPLVNTGFGRKN